ncbi:MAG: hypothetical protein JXD23_02125 [Spirochaetales bacterium]|nr:hypothetical protein [Spirochaetales bacterium]
MKTRVNAITPSRAIPSAFRRLQDEYFSETEASDENIMAVRALLPWIADASLLKRNRAYCLSGLRTFHIPEAVPPLKELLKTSADVGEPSIAVHLLAQYGVKPFSKDILSHIYQAGYIVFFKSGDDDQYDHMATQAVIDFTRSHQRESSIVLSHFLAAAGFDETASKRLHLFSAAFRSKIRDLGLSIADLRAVLSLGDAFPREWADVLASLSGKSGPAGAREMHFYCSIDYDSREQNACIAVYKDSAVLAIFKLEQGRIVVTQTRPLRKNEISAFQKLLVDNTVNRLPFFPRWDTCGYGGGYCYYQFRLDGGFRIVAEDGPPDEYGRLRSFLWGLFPKNEKSAGP